MTDIFREMFNKTYGRRVTMEYIDVQETDKLELYPEVKSLLETKKAASLPLVAFNGKPLWLGSLSYPLLLEELAKRGIKPVA